MKKDREFAVLVGKAFLREVEAKRTERAIAFGRAFLLSLGMTGPDDILGSPMSKDGPSDENAVLVPN